MIVYYDSRYDSVVMYYYNKDMTLMRCNIFPGGVFTNWPAYMRSLEDVRNNTYTWEWTLEDTGDL